MFRYIYHVCFSINYFYINYKEEKSSYIVIKNLHPVADQKVITDELEEREHKTFAFAYNIGHGIIYLLLLFVDLDPFLNDKKIFTINSSYKIYKTKMRRYSYPEKN